MNKTELVNEIANRADLSKHDAHEALDAILSTIVDAVAKGDTVTVVGFGTFEKQHYAARQGRNPQTGETITIPASYRPHFKAGKNFKDAVKG